MRDILIVGNWRWEIYEEALSRGFQNHKWNVISFRTGDYLPGGSCAGYLIKARLSPLLSDLNASLLKAFESNRPEAVLIYRSDLILPSTLERMKEIKSDTILLLYHNDNPFISLWTRLKMRYYLRSIRLADVTLVYRPSNITDAKRFGARRVELFLPYFLSYLHRPVPAGESCDVLFIGHYEPDERAEYVHYLKKNGINVRIYGARWEKAREKYQWAIDKDIRPVVGEEYSSLLSSAKIALVFLSARHRDVYTRRCFEIPACGAMMLAPRTRELEDLFEEGREAIYFDSREDLLYKASYYLCHEDKRSLIAKAGRERCLRDGHDETARAAQLIRIIEKIKPSILSRDASSTLITSNI